MPSKPRTFLASPDGISQLNAAKARLKLTTAAIAKLAGVSADTVGRLLRGKRVGEASVEAHRCEFKRHSISAYRLGYDLS